jgi:hypothetical protein
MFKRLFLLLTFCSIVSVLTVWGQKPENEAPPERPVEQPRNDPPPPPRDDPPPRNDPPPPRSDPPPPPREESRPSNPNSGSSSNNSSGSDNSNSRERRRDRDNDADTPRRGRKTDDEIKRPKNPENPPTENPNPTPNPPPVGGNNPNQDERDDRNRRRNRNGSWGGGYPYPPIYYPSPTTTTSSTFSWRQYFDKDDVFFNIYQSYLDPNSVNFSPYFESPLRADFEPLYYIYGREFFLTELPFVADDWTIYYEPDLDDVFVNLHKLGQAKFEKMVWFAVGDTYRKVTKKANYKGQTVRPVIVETLPQLASDKLYSFSVADLPKGEYEMRFIARDGTTLRHFIRLK